MDKCVKCAACIPACPSYRVVPREGYTPRGRIALVQGLLSGELAPGPGVRAQLDACLFCRACERVCPSGVSMEPILNAGAALSGARPLWRRVLRGILSSGLASRPLPVLLRALVLVAGRLPFLAALRRLRVPGSLGEAARPEQGGRGVVTLFLGCAARSLDRGTLLDSVAILEAWGYEVRLPSGQACCGALALHDGDTAGALDKARANLCAFGAEERTPNPEQCQRLRSPAP